MIQMRALISQNHIIRIHCQRSFKAILLHSTQIPLKLHQFDFPVAINQINPSVPVKQQGAVMVIALQFFPLPWTFHFFCGIDIGFLGLKRTEADIKFSVMEAQ